MRVLTVTNPFGGHALGDTIADPAEVKAVLAGEHAGHVVARAADPEADAPPRGRKPHTQE